MRKEAAAVVVVAVVVATSATDDSDNNRNNSIGVNNGDRVRKTGKAVAEGKKFIDPANTGAAGKRKEDP